MKSNKLRFKKEHIFDHLQDGTKTVMSPLQKQNPVFKVKKARKLKIIKIGEKNYEK